MSLTVSLVTKKTVKYITNENIKLYSIHLKLIFQILLYCINKKFIISLINIYLYDCLV